MGHKHKVYKATLDRGYASEWNDDHIQSFATHIDMYVCIRAAALTACWDFAQTAGGSNPAVSLVGAAGSGHAFVVFNTGGVTGQSSSMRKELAGAVANITSPDDLPTLTFSLEISAVHSVGNVAEFGLLNSGDAIFLANADGAYFRIFDDELYAVTGEGAAETTTNLGAWSQYSHYRIEFASAAVNFYVDDMVNPAAVHTTHRPDSDLTMKFSVISANNVDSTIRMDGCALQVLRKQ